MSQKSKKNRIIQNSKSQRGLEALASSQLPYPLNPQEYVPPTPNYAYNHAPCLPLPTPYPYQNPSQYYPNPYLPPQPYPYAGGNASAVNPAALRSYIDTLENAHRKLVSESLNVTPLCRNKPMPLISIHKDNESGLKLPEGMTKKFENIYGKKKGNVGDSIPLKGHPNPKNKGQPRPSPIKKDPAGSGKSQLPGGMTITEKKDKGNSAKSQAETCDPGTKNIDGKKNVGGSIIPLKGQPNPKNKNKARRPKKTLDQGARSASLNDIAARKNSLPIGQPKLEKSLSLLGNQKKGNQKKGEEKSKPGNLYVTINADIDITLKLSKHLEARLKQKIKFKVKFVIKDAATGYVRFLLEFESQNKMTNAVRFFNDSNKNNSIKVECKKVGEDKRGPKKTNMGNKLKCQNETVQQQHNKKIENVRNKITSLMSSVGDAFPSQENNNGCVKALKQKEKELLYQLVEYKKAQHDLDQQLKMLEKDKKDDSEEGKNLVKRLIQEQKFLSESMPLYAMRTKITEAVLKNQVTILMGSCGTGKSTQLVQYLMETSLVDDGPIVFTEPSETQALSTARHVAGEINSSLGNLVGFSSEKDIHMNIYTNVLFMSEHDLIDQFRKMKTFGAYSCIVIDEVQEKTVYTDLLLGLLKLELEKKPRLRIVLVTAPMEIGIYQSFFTDHVLLEVDTCSFPVQVIWSDPDQNDQTKLFENGAIEQAIKVHCQEDEGDILVFVASVAEVLECCTDFKSCMKKDNYVCLPLYNGITYDQLKSIYRPLSSGKRKIIFATSCAEVMNAVPNVRYIIDNGLKKESFLESGDKDELQISLISQDAAERRKERAGSSPAGKCYRLYSPDDFRGMKTTDPEEMSLTGSIEKVVMKLLGLEIDPMNFRFPTSVTEKKVSSVIKTLDNLGCLLNDSGKYKLTDLGTKISKLPFRFDINWMLLKGIQRGLKMESVALACLSGLKQEVFCIKRKYNDRMQMMHNKFGEPGESIARRTLGVLAAWYRKPRKEKESWCAEHFFDNSTLKLINLQMNNLSTTLSTELELDVKFTPLQDTNIDDLKKLMDDTLTNFNSSTEECN